MAIMGYDREVVLKAIGVTIVALFVTNIIPIVNFIKLIPTFKEVVIGGLVVAGLTSISDTTEGVKFALLTGMIAAVLFNLFYIPFQVLFGGLAGGMMSGTEMSPADGAMGTAAVAGLGAMLNLVGVVIFSPIGYAIGGALGTLAND
jgi:hypothetical protein